MSDKLEWCGFFESAGFPTVVSKEYADVFIRNRITKALLPDLDRDLLKEMGIRVVGDIMLILKHCKLVKEMGFNKVVQQTVTSSTELTPSISNTIIPPGHEVPVNTRRFVSKEHEGNYTVRLPQGKTEKTRRLLPEIKRLRDAKSRSRPDQETYEDEDDDDMIEVAISVDGSKTKSIAKFDTNNSVFSRLGRSQGTSGKPESIRMGKDLLKTHLLQASASNNLSGNPQAKLPHSASFSSGLSGRLGQKRSFADPSIDEARVLPINKLRKSEPIDRLGGGGIFSKHDRISNLPIHSRLGDASRAAQPSKSLKQRLG